MVLEGLERFSGDCISIGSLPWELFSGYIVDDMESFRDNHRGMGRRYLFSDWGVISDNGTFESGHGKRLAMGYWDWSSFRLGQGFGNKVGLGRR
jgi:hypothetical protein